MLNTRGNNNNKTVHKKLEIDEIYSIALSGGGAGGLSFAGVLWQLNQAGLSFNKIKRTIGTSVGSVAALAIALNLEPDDMFSRLASIDFTKIQDIGPFLNIKTVKRLIRQQRLYQGEVIFEHVLQLLRDTTGRSDPKNITFSDLKEMGFKDLYVVTTELSVINQKEGHGEKKVFSFETTPHAPVAWVIRASTAAPPYFPGVIFKCDAEGRYTVLPSNTKDPEAKLIVDGALSENYPLSAFDFQKYIDADENNDVNPSSVHSPLEMLRYEKPHRIYGESWSRENIERTNKVCNPYTLGIALHWPIDTPKSALPTGRPIYEIQAIINSLLSKPQNDFLGDEANYLRSILVKRIISLTDFDIGPTKQKEVIAAGIESVCDYFNMPFDQSYRYFLDHTTEHFRSEPNESVSQETIPVLKLSASERWLLFGNPADMEQASIRYQRQDKTEPESAPKSSPCILM